MRNKVTKFGFLILVAVLLVAMAFGGAASATEISANDWNKMGDSVTVPTDGIYTFNDSDGNLIYPKYNGSTGFTPGGNLILDFTNYHGTFYGEPNAVSQYKGALFGYVELSGVSSERTLEIRGLTLTNVKVNTTSGNHIGGIVGFFNGNSGTNSILTFTDCRLVNCSITGASGSVKVGGLVGDAYPASLNAADCKIQHCDVVTGGIQVGGLAGAAYTGSFVRCNVTNSTVASTGGTSVGGLVGYAYTPSFEMCGIENTSVYGASVSGGGIQVGGLVGCTCSAKKIENCCVMNCVIASGANEAGGLVGEAYSIENGVKNVIGCLVKNCTIAGSSRVGGLVGYAGSASGCSGNRVEYSAVKGTGSEVRLDCGNGKNLGCTADVDKNFIDSSTVGSYDIITLYKNSGASISLPDATFWNTIFNTTGAKSATPTTISQVTYLGEYGTAGGYGALHYPIYDVIVYTDGRGTASANRTTCPENGVVNLTADPNSGFQFGYWENTVTKAHLSTSNPCLITMPNHNLNVTAHFVRTQFNVTVHSVGNGTASPEKEQYEIGAVVTLIPNPEPGYKLSKWESPNVTAFSGNTFIMPAEDVDVTAYFTKDTTGIGAGEFILTGLGEGAANVKVYYDEPRKTLFVENTNPTGSSTGSSLGDAVLTITQFGFSDSDVKIIEVDYDVSLGNNPNVFSKFVNARLNYMGESIPDWANVGGKPLYRVNATNSTVYIEAKQSYTGEAATLDTNYAFPGQDVRIIVEPLQNYSVYGWTVIMSGGSQDDAGAVLTRSLDPNDGASTYILTMPASDVIVIPKLRDQGSTFVTYIFLDADTYVMEIPADFSLTGINKTVEGKEVNITACDLFDGHNLTVTMASANGYDGDGFFRLLSVNDRSAQATYAIGEKDIYLGSSEVEPVQKENKVVLDTSQIAGSGIPGSTVIEDLIAEGNLKTELQFTLKQMLKPEFIGKYKDKLTFTVEITTA